MNVGPAIIKWLLNGDPAVRWQTLKDILQEDPGVIQKERLMIGKAGWGKLLLDKQDTNGGWGGGIYTPKWTSATYTMLLLRQIGLAPGNRQAMKACKLLIDKGYYPDGGINFWSNHKYSETCVTGMILSILCYFGYRDKRIPGIAGYLIDQQMEDGGWNCRRFMGAHHSSFHTTISVLEGVKYYLETHTEAMPEFEIPVRRSHEFLLMHKLYKSDKTGKIVDTKMTRLSFPPQWHYDILRCLDYFQSIKAEKDERMSDAVELLLSKKSSDGTWPLQQRYAGKKYFDMEPEGKPSRWNTLRALRVVDWWSK